MSAPTDFLYNNARSLFTTKQLNWPVETIKVALLNSLYTPSLQDVNLSAVPAGAFIARDIVMTNLAQIAGVCSGTIPEFIGLTSVYTCVAVLIYKSTGLDTTSPMIYYSSTGVGFPFKPAGFNYFVGFDTTSGGWFQV